MFCQGLDEAHARHTRKECPLFRQLKQNTSSQPYIDVQLRPQDREGYAAAGVLLWRRTSDGQLEMLLAREYRSKGRDTGGDNLNFLGGKRLKREVDALTCAVDKATQEMGGQLSPVTTTHMREGCPLVCWSSDSKYVLFLFELVGENDCEVDVRCAGMPNTKRLEWATRQELLERSWTRQQMHPFAIEMLEQLTSCGIMEHLEEVFDVAYAPTLEPSPREGLSADQVAEHFDIVGAIRSSLESARPDSLLLLSRLPPTYTQLRAAAQDIPSRDRKKLCLRFHPDRVMRVLGHPPSEKEGSIAHRAMQILNGLMDTSDPSESDIMGNLKDLNSQRAKLANAASSQSKENVEQVQDLLSRLSMSP
jgi:hypothetical protein